MSSSALKAGAGGSASAASTGQALNASAPKVQVRMKRWLKVWNGMCGFPPMTRIVRIIHGTGPWIQRRTFARSVRQRIQREIDAEANRGVGFLLRIVRIVGALPAVGDVVVEGDHHHHAALVVEYGAPVRRVAAFAIALRQVL